MTQSSEATIWPSEGLRRASVNSFGFGGSNTHCIVEDALHFLQSRSLPGKHSTVESPKLPSGVGTINQTTNGYDHQGNSSQVSHRVSAAAVEL
jgi:acyl transferase domain-containing protein